MAKKQFKAESKRLLGLMIDSIYTHKEIFLRELISNASDAIDKLCYQSLTEGSVGLDRSDFFIRVAADEEARTITVKQILIKTFYRDVSGNRIDYNEKQKQEAYSRASTMLKRLQNGEDFDALAERYNEDSQMVYSFDKDSNLPKEFVDTAFNMETDEVSDIIETPFGYHVLKCVSTFDREETDENKQKILVKKKEEVFSRTYDEFVQSQYSGLTDELYNATTYDRSVLETDESFFDVYNRVFTDNKGS